MHFEMRRHRNLKRERERIQTNKSTIIKVRSDIAQGIHIKRFSCVNKCHISIKRFESVIY